MLPVSRIFPAQPAQLPLLLLWLFAAPAPLKPHQSPARSWALPLLGFNKHSQNWCGCCQRWGLEHSWHFLSPLGFVLEKLWLHSNATGSHTGCYHPHRLPAQLVPFGSCFSCTFSKTGLSLSQHREAELPTRFRQSLCTAQGPWLQHQ